MRKIWLIILSMVVSFLQLGCEEELISGAMEYRYLFYAYFVPQSLYLTSYSGKGVNNIEMYGDEYVTSKSNPDKFTELLNEYGEMGDGIIRSIDPQVRKPIGIDSIRVYRLDMDNGLMVDVSSEWNISYRNAYPFISSNYKSKQQFVSKKVSELTEHDYQWICYQFNINSQISDGYDNLLVVSLKNETDLFLKVED